MRKHVLLFGSVTMLILVSFSVVTLGNKALTCLACEAEGGVVDKMPCESFKVKIIFKNTGKTEGKWSVNIAFEGEAWIWSGTPQTLTLKPSKAKTLTWNGTVPCDAQVDSVARLIVYYNDSFNAIDWWIHVTSGAELTITSSTVD
ncbi:hypothetical protein HXY33_07605 [Candidatus Bathyarchaeota archaeon]|nr:hypothetical protein [Candidatus Bathyarchaeota archaeon]